LPGLCWQKVIKDGRWTFHRRPQPALVTTHCRTSGLSSVHSTRLLMILGPIPCGLHRMDRISISNVLSPAHSQKALASLAGVPVFSPGDPASRGSFYLGLPGIFCYRTDTCACHFVSARHAASSRCDPHCSVFR